MERILFVDEKYLTTGIHEMYGKVSLRIWRPYKFTTLGIEHLLPWAGTAKGFFSAPGWDGYG